MSALLAFLANERDNVRFLPTNLEGAMLLEIEPLRDQRGFFARTFCEREFAQHGLETHFVQHSISQTSVQGFGTRHAFSEGRRERS